MHEIATAVVYVPRLNGLENRIKFIENNIKNFK